LYYQRIFQQRIDGMSITDSAFLQRNMLEG